MENLKAQQFWVIYLKRNDYDGETTQEGIVTNLEDFAKLAKEKYGIESEPIMDYYGRGSMHYEYSVQKGVSYTEYYYLVAEPSKLINYTDLSSTN